MKYFRAHRIRPSNILTLSEISIKLPLMLRILRLLLWILCIFLVVFIVSILVQKQDSGVPQPAPNLSGLYGGNLILAVDADPSNFNQIFVTGTANRSITEKISGDLVHINKLNLQLEPSLATEWEADATGRIYTLHLRKGVRFSDGSPFNADDVLFSFTAITDPHTQCPISGQIEIDGTYPSFAKIDDFTVQLTFHRPVGMGLRMLDNVPILPKNRLARAYREGKLSSVWGPNVDPTNVVGLGPFRLREYETGVRIVLERNPYYWKKDRSGQKLPYLDSITYLIIRDPISECLRFQKGELDLTCSPTLTPENFSKLRSSPEDYTVRKLGPGLTTYFLWFNLNNGTNRVRKPFVDPDKKMLFEKPAFRRAISCAIDRDGMIRSILLGLGVPQYGPLSPGNTYWHFAGISKTDFNPHRARELLAQAGLKDANKDGILEYGNKHRPLELTLLTSRDNLVCEKGIQVIKDNLLKIGIRSRIQYLLNNEIAARVLGSFDYEAVFFGITPTDVVPDLQTDLWYSSGKFHFWNPNQKKPARPWESKMDELTSAFVTSMDPVARKAAFDKVQQLWIREMPAIPTITPSILAAWSNRLDNIHPSVLMPHLIWNAEEITKRKP